MSRPEYTFKVMDAFDPASLEELKAVVLPNNHSALLRLVSIMKDIKDYQKRGLTAYQALRKEATALADAVMGDVVEYAIGASVEEHREKDEGSVVYRYPSGLDDGLLALLPDRGFEVENDPNMDKVIRLSRSIYAYIISMEAIVAKRKEILDKEYELDQIRAIHEHVPAQ